MAQAQGVTGGVRLVLRLEGLAAFVVAVLLYRHLGGSWVWWAVLLLTPDLSMLGYLAGPRIGALSYNIAHSYLGPAALAGLALAGGPAWAGLGAAIWVAHIGADRMLGFGLKYVDGFGFTHLGRVGRAATVAA